MAVAVERRTITRLAEFVDSLSGYDREVFDHVMRVTVTVGQLESDTLPLDELRSQTIIKIQNRI